MRTKKSISQGSTFLDVMVFNWLFGALNFEQDFISKFGTTRIHK